MSNLSIMFLSTQSDLKSTVQLTNCKPDMLSIHLVNIGNDMTYTTKRDEKGETTKCPTTGRLSSNYCTLDASFFVLFFFFF